jgi:hypothetical protein
MPFPAFSKWKCFKHSTNNLEEYFSIKWQLGGHTTCNNWLLNLRGSESTYIFCPKILQKHLYAEILQPIRWNREYHIIWLYLWWICKYFDRVWSVALAGQVKKKHEIKHKIKHEAQQSHFLYSYSHDKMTLISRGWTEISCSARLTLHIYEDLGQWS